MGGNSRRQLSKQVGGAVCTSLHISAAASFTRIRSSVSSSSPARGGRAGCNGHWFPQPCPHTGVEMLELLAQQLVLCLVKSLQRGGDCAVKERRGPPLVHCNTGPNRMTARLHCRSAAPALRGWLCCRCLPATHCLPASQIPAHVCTSGMAPAGVSTSKIGFQAHQRLQAGGGKPQ